MASPPTAKTPDAVSVAPQTIEEARNLPPQAVSLSPEWSLGRTFDIHVYLSTSPDGDIFNKPHHTYNLPSFVWSNVTYGDWADTRTLNYDIKFPETVLRSNGTLWAEIFLVKENGHPNYSKRKTYDSSKVHHIRKPLTTYLPKTKIRKQRNLLTSANATEEEEPEEVPKFRHLVKSVCLPKFCIA